MGTALLVSFLGGVVALLAPCCVSVMLPAYLATGFRHRGTVVAATLVFGAGVATLILPIGLGATAVSRLLVGGHLWVFSIGGALMIAAGIAVLAGWRLDLPMPGARAAAAGSFRSAYLLGVFSGAASACCAPVLAGVAVLAGAAASFPAALLIGLAYVAGMVTPLALIATVWDARRERAARALTGKTVVLRWGTRRRALALGTVLSAALMIAMGMLSIVLALSGPGMPGGSWQAEMSGWLQHLSASVAHALTWLPGWAVIGILAALSAAMVRRARRTAHRGSEDCRPEHGAQIPQAPR